jgi:hypothetical protein
MFVQVMRGKGDEKILFRNGSRILFGARETGFGRGFSDVDVLVFDEAQIMTEATLEDMAAAQNVAKNPLTFMMGTPPRPKDPGEVFSMHRQEALDGESDETLYIELSADRGSDPLDREQWRKANPSFPKRTSERAMLRLRKKLKSLDSWLREALGVWDEEARFQPAIASHSVEGLFDVAVDGNQPDSLGVDMSHRGEISISACWVNEDFAHAEEVWAEPMRRRRSSGSMRGPAANSDHHRQRIPRFGVGAGVEAPRQELWCCRRRGIWAKRAAWSSLGRKRDCHPRRPGLGH